MNLNKNIYIIFNNVGMYVTTSTFNYIKRVSKQILGFRGRAIQGFLFFNIYKMTENV